MIEKLKLDRSIFQKRIILLNNNKLKFISPSVYLGSL